MRANPGTIPPNGWHFDQPIPGSDKPITIKASSKDQLRERLYNFRVEQNISIGDVERDIDRFICPGGPGLFCDPEPTDFGLPPEVPRDKHISLRVAEWVSRMRRLPQQPMVSLAIAAERHEICAKCHRNQHWAGPCGACDDRVKSESAIVRGLRLPAKVGASACQITGWDNDTASHFTAPTLNVTENENSVMPNFCWGKKK